MCVVVCVHVRLMYNRKKKLNQAIWQWGMDRWPMIDGRIELTEHGVCESFAINDTLIVDFSKWSQLENLMNLKLRRNHGFIQTFWINNDHRNQKFVFLHNIGTISSIPSQSHYTQLCQTCPHIFFSNLFQIYGSHITHSLCSWQRSLAWFLINGTQVPFLHICLPIHYRICHICPNLFCKHTIQERMLPPSTHITWPVM